MLGGLSGVGGASSCSCLLPRSDIFSLQPSVWNYQRGEKNQLLWHMKTYQRLSSVKNKRLGSQWKDHVKCPNNADFNGLLIEKKRIYCIKVVAAAAESNCLVSTVNDEVHDTNSQYNSNSDSQVLQSPYVESPELYNREKLRRMRISKANKGNVPWNKGRKHSPETLRRIRERTRIAMQDPKVMSSQNEVSELGTCSEVVLLQTQVYLNLAIEYTKHNLKYQEDIEEWLEIRRAESLPSYVQDCLSILQNEETRIKIAVGVREGWQRRRKKLMLQEGCFLEWQNIIAEATRKGYAGEDELQWNSYKVLHEQLKEEWLESVEKRKTMPTVTGSKRAPKPPEHRRKISEAIYAKWTDPEYRERVCTALSKYYGTPIGAERRERKPANRDPVKRDSIKKKLVETKRVTSETRNNKRRKATKPLYKDPMANVKFEMIKKIRVQRAAAESKKQEATRRARLLIAEAEKAANALEVAALTSPIARASLSETRKLIAEAMLSIEGIEGSKYKMQEDDDISLSFTKGDRHMPPSVATQNTDEVTNEPPLINGKHFLSSNGNNYRGFDFDKSTQQSVTNSTEMSRIATCGENSIQLMHHHLSPLLQPEGMRKDPTTAKTQVGHPAVNGSAGLDKEAHIGEEDEEDENSTSATETKMKWICGKLVEVEEH